MLRLTLMAVLILASPGGRAALLVDETFAGYTAAGLAPGGPAGTLDSQMWCVIGAGDGDTVSGATATSGDFARGQSAGGERSGGLYAFALPGDRRGLGVQATGSDFTPGALIRHALNLSGDRLDSLLLEAELWVLNDGARSTRITLDAASGDGPWQPLPDATLFTAQDADTLGWQRFDIVASLPLPVLSPGAALTLRIGFDDAAGLGARDEFALAALRVSGSVDTHAPVALAAPGPAWLLLPGTLLLGRRLRRRNATARPR